MDGNGRTNSLDCSIFLHDPCEFFLWDYLKVQVFRELSQNISDLKTKIRHAFSSITEETLQKVFQNIGKGLSFVACQNGGQFENMLK